MTDKRKDDTIPIDRVTLQGVREALQTSYDMSTYAAATKQRNTDEFLRGTGYDDGGLFGKIGMSQLKIEQALASLDAVLAEGE